MKRIENVDYRQNEWAVLYVDHNGERQAEACDSWDEAVKRADHLRFVGVPTIGIVTSYFYNAEMADE